MGGHRACDDVGRRGLGLGRRARPELSTAATHATTICHVPSCHGRFRIRSYANRNCRSASASRSRTRSPYGHAASHGAAQPAHRAGRVDAGTSP